MLRHAAHWRSSITANLLSNYLHSSLRNLFHLIGETLTNPPLSREAVPRLFFDSDLSTRICRRAGGSPFDDVTSDHTSRG